jgi:hypothetical protein
VTQLKGKLWQQLENYLANADKKKKILQISLKRSEKNPIPGITKK